MKTLAVLFKKTSTGAIQQWGILSYRNEIHTTWGQVGGAMQVTVDKIQGKNIGKKNETTPEQQAELEALSQWTKKKKKGYVESIVDAESGTVDKVIEGGVFPMLAHKFSEHGDKIQFPAYVQPKFDGHRCIAIVDKKGSCTLWSRTRKPITGLPHIVAAIENSGMKNITLDGELYNHDYKNRFEELTSFIRNPEPKEGSEIVHYKIYDIADNTLSFEDRLNEIYKLSLYTPLSWVQTQKVVDVEELMVMFEIFVSQGYEGAMVRNIEGKYVNKRSYDLQKVKEFDDAEFEIVDVEEGRGKLARHAIFVCVASGGMPFRVKMRGETEKLKLYFENPSLAIGKKLTVKYQGLTGKYKLPRFPVGERIREE